MDEKDRKGLSEEIAKKLAKAMGLDPSKVKLLGMSVTPSASAGVGMNAASMAKADGALDVLFEHHRDEAMATVELAKGIEHKGACCNDCAVRAVAGGQVEGAVRAFLKLSSREDLFRNVQDLHKLVTEALEDILDEDQPDAEEGASA